MHSKCLDFRTFSTTAKWVFIILFSVEAEKSLQAQLLAIGNDQLKDQGKIRDISKIVENVVWQERQYQREVADIQELISDIRQKLLKAKQDLQSVVSVLFVIF